MRQLYLFDAFDEGYERGEDEGKESLPSARLGRVPIHDEGQGTKTVESTSG
jgi:hypothetical protein